MYQLTLRLEHSEPPVWRTLQVLNTTSLEDLHDMFQVAMGWQNEQAYQFIINDHYYGDDDLGSSGNRSDAGSVRLGELIKRGKVSFMYEYDLSDGWEHHVHVDKIRPLSAEEAVQLPRCIAGENACPPEECGGIFGYYELLSLLKDPEHPAYAEMVEQYGVIDPRAFDLSAVNQNLNNLFQPVSASASGS